MKSALYDVYTLVVLYQKSHSFASLTCLISYTPQLVCKHRMRALSMKYSIYIVLQFSLKVQIRRTWDGLHRSSFINFGQFFPRWFVHNTCWFKFPFLDKFLTCGFLERWLSIGTTFCTLYVEKSGICKNMHTT